MEESRARASSGQGQGSRTWVLTWVLQHALPVELSVEELASVDGATREGVLAVPLHPPILSVAIVAGGLQRLGRGHGSSERRSQPRRQPGALSSRWCAWNDNFFRSLVFTPRKSLIGACAHLIMLKSTLTRVS